MPDTRDLQAARNSFGDVGYSIQDESEAIYSAYSFDDPEAGVGGAVFPVALARDDVRSWAEPEGLANDANGEMPLSSASGLGCSTSELASAETPVVGVPELGLIDSDGGGQDGSLRQSLVSRDWLPLDLPESTAGLATASLPEPGLLGSGPAESLAAPGAPLSQADIIRIGMAMARASYGESAISPGGTTDFGPFRGNWQGIEVDPLGYDDDYRHYIGSWTHGDERWSLVGPDELRADLLVGANWTSGGLFRSGVGLIGDPDRTNQGEALVALRDVGGVRTLVLSFRGSDGSDAFWEGQTFTSLGLYEYYDGLRPIINAVAAFVAENSIENVVVSGHSLGGTLVDYFARVSAGLFAGTNLTLVSVASAGLPLAGSILPINAAVDDYIGIAHSEDRVHFPYLQQFGDELTPTTPLLGNTPSPIDFHIHLPNLTNSEVIYPGRGWGEADHGFGAEHNGELYWANLDALTRDILFSRFTNQSIVMGLTDYSSIGDVNGSFAMFQGYTGLANPGYFNDSGTRSLTGFGGTEGDYILGLAGNDVLLGRSGNDLLSGGIGTDRLEGRAGRDVLAGGSGADQLIGGTQGDVFLFTDIDFPSLIGPVPQDRITDYNRGTGSFLSTEGDLIDLSGIHFASGAGSSSTVRLRSVAASGDLPAGALLEVLVGDVAAGNWQAIARLDGVASGETIRIALNAAQSAARTGTNFVVDAVGNGTTWSVSTATATVDEGNVTLTFTITRSGTHLGAETVYVSTVQNQGFYNDGDYVGRLNLPISFAAGETSKTFSVRINADAVAEGDETFGVIVQANPTDPVSVHHAATTFTIRDGAAPVVRGDNYVGDGLDNTWSGTSTRDIAFGMGGNDRLSGAGGNDILVGGGGADEIFGGSGNDVILTGSLADFARFGGGGVYIDAGNGDDYIDARMIGLDGDGDGILSRVFCGSGDDTIIAGSSWDFTPQLALQAFGGEGSDTLVLETVDFSHSESFSYRFGNSAPLSAISAYTEIEAALLPGAECFINSSFDPVNGVGGWILLESFESLVLRGSSNDDLIIDGLSYDLTVALGGGGTDALYADWSTTTAAIVWNITANNEVQRTLGNGLVVQSIERLMLRTGSGNDNLVMGDRDDHVETGAGNDSIITGGGENYVDGGSGNDFIDGRHYHTGYGTLLGGSGDDTIMAGSGASNGFGFIVDGGDGVDLLVVEAFDFFWPTVAEVSHRFGDGPVLGAFSSFDDIASEIAGGGLHRISSNRSSSDYNWIAAENIERFEYRGGTNHDLFLGWNGNLTSALGGEGQDAVFADWSTTTAAIVWNITANNDVQRTLGNGVVVQSIERLMLKTGSGNDNLIMGDREDHVETGAGNDSIITGGGENYVDGGSGNDFIDGRHYRGGSGTLLGGSGDDTIMAGSVIYGGVGFMVDGGDGVDLLVVQAFDGYWPSYAEVSHRFGDGPVLGAFSSFDDIASGIAGGGLHRVSSNGNGIDYYWIAAENIERFEYRGGTNNDLFLGWNGNLTAALGGGGQDAVFADWSTTTAAIVWNITANNDVERTLGNGVVVQSIERLLLKTGSGNDNLIMGNHGDRVETGAGNDRLNGGGGDDVLIGGVGNDTVTGGSGSDSLDGSLGLDTLNYSSSSSGVTVNLALNTAAGGDAAGDTIAGFETVLGGAGSDQLTGSAGANLLSGNDGTDNLSGGGGNDTLLGGGGNDMLAGGNGADSLNGGSGADSLNGDAGADILVGSIGRDTLTGGTGGDVFVFDTALSTGNIDQITDFSVVDDTIRLGDAVFAGLATGFLAAGAFVANLSGQATTATQRILYETDTGRLFFDADGVGGAARVQFATISVGLALTSADFEVI